MICYFKICTLKKSCVYWQLCWRTKCLPNIMIVISPLKTGKNIFVSNQNRNHYKKFNCTFQNDKNCKHTYVLLLWKLIRPVQYWKKAKIYHRNRQVKVIEMLFPPDIIWKWIKPIKFNSRKVFIQIYTDIYLPMDLRDGRTIYFLCYWNWWQLPMI